MLEMVPVETKIGKRVVSASNGLQAPVEILSASQGKPRQGKKA